MDQVTKIHSTDETLLFSSSLLPHNDNPKIKIRPLSINDYFNGYLNLLSQLTTVGKVTQEEFESQFRKMIQAKGYFIIIAEDAQTGDLLGSSTVFIEQKFIHQCSSVPLVIFYF